MTRLSRFTLLAAGALAFLAVPAQAQDTPAPDTIYVSSPENDARARFNEGNSLLREEDYEGALAKFDEGLSLDPSNGRNAYGRALALAQLDREDDAVAAFQQAIELSDARDDEETGTAARRALGQISYRKAMALMQANPLPETNAEQALPMLEEAEAGGVDTPMLPYQMARALNVLQRYEDAERYAMMAVENSESDDKSAFYIELGLARMNSGDIAGAREAFEMTRDGQWGSWGEHYLRQLDEQQTDGADEGAGG